MRIKQDERIIHKLKSIGKHTIVRISKGQIIRPILYLSSGVNSGRLVLGVRGDRGLLSRCSSFSNLRGAGDFKASANVKRPAIKAMKESMHFYVQIGFCTLHLLDLGDFIPVYFRTPFLYTLSKVP